MGTMLYYIASQITGPKTDG